MEKLISSVFEADQEYIRINLLNVNIYFKKSRPPPALVPFIHIHKAHTPFSVLNNGCSSTKKQQNNNNKRTAAALHYYRSLCGSAARAAFAVIASMLCAAANFYTHHTHTHTLACQLSHVCVVC